MNYTGKFDFKLHTDDGSSSHSNANLHVETVSSVHAPSDAIIVPDANLLFNGDFKRSGVDLILSKDDHELVVHDYFKGEMRAALSSPDGAHLTGDIVNALTGHVQYSQADGNASVGQVTGHVIGHVTKLGGSATAVRNGVSIILNMGDNVEKGDVVQSGSDSTLGITFIDGTVFGLSSNARMVLNEMVYDPNGSNNSSLLSLVAGTISFVAGETAKHGDMKIDTPVATMGIRGTAVLVEIDFDILTQAGTPGAKFQVLVEPDGSAGSYILFDKTTLAPIATVNQPGTATVISNGSVNFLTSAPLSADQQKLITDVFSLKFTDNTNPNTKLADQHTDTLTPQATQFVKLADGTTALVTTVTLNTVDKSSSSGSGVTGRQLDHIDGPPAIAVVDVHGNVATPVSFSVTELLGKTGDTADVDIASGNINFADINAGDRPTVTATLDASNPFTWQNAAHQSVTVTLSAQQLSAVEAKLAIVPASGNTNNGSATWTYSVPDNAFDFLAAGETFTLTYAARVDNNFAQNDEASTENFTITIHGTNDVPVITTSASALTFTGDHQANGFLVSAADPATGQPVPTSGMLAFKDPDLTDTHSVSVKLAVPPGSDIPPGPLAAFEAALTASIGTDSTGTGNGTINWELAPLPDSLADFLPQGQSITLIYAITVTDSLGATATLDVTVTLGHATPPDVAWIHPTGGFWNTASNWETGTVPTASDDVVIPDEQIIGGTGSYVVTINTAAFAHSVTLNAENTDGGQIMNESTLTIGGELTLLAHGLLNNFGTVIVGDKMELLDQSLLANSGLLILENGGDFEEGTTVANFRFRTNPGRIDLVGGTLNDKAAIINSGVIAVEGGATLTLWDVARVAGGELDNKGTLNLQGISSLDVGSLFNLGHINVNGTSNALESGNVINGGLISITGTMTLDNGVSIEGGTLTNSGTVDIESSSGATLDGVSVKNESGIIQVDNAELPTTVMLLVDDGTVITGGTLSIGSFGVLDVEAAILPGTPDATLDGVTVLNSGGIHVGTAFAGGPTLLLDDGTTITGGTLSIGHGDTLDIEPGAVNGKGATLDHVNVAGADLTSTIKVGGGSTLTLNDATISCAVVTVESGSVISGFGTISDAVGNDGKIEANGGLLDIAGAITGSGSTTVDGGATLELGGSNIQTVMFSGTAATLKLDDPFHFNGNITGTAIGDVIELATEPGVTVTSATLAGSILTVTESDGHSLAFNVAGDLLENDFHIHNLDGGGADLVLSQDPLAEAPSLAGTSTSVTGPADTEISFLITPALSADAPNDPDASLSLTISNIPTDATLSNAHGVLTVDGGSISFSATQLADGVLNGLTITPTPTDDPNFNLHVTATTTDGTGPTASTASTSQDIQVNVTPALPVIITDHFSVTQNPDGTPAISGLGVTDANPAASSEIFTVIATTSAPGTSLSEHTDTGSLARINADLESGGSYNPGPTPPSTDKVTLTVAGSFGDSDTVNFIFKATATDPDSPLLGTPGKDVIVATGHTDTLIGGGGQDQFVFTPTFSSSTAQHMITDFVSGLDKIDVRQFGNISSFNDLHETQQGNDTLITLDSLDTVLLKNVALANLHAASDFIFHPGAFS